MLENSDDMCLSVHVRQRRCDFLSAVNLRPLSGTAICDLERCCVSVLYAAISLKFRVSVDTDGGSGGFISTRSADTLFRLERENTHIMKLPSYVVFPFLFLFFFESWSDPRSGHVPTLVSHSQAHFFLFL